MYYGKNVRISASVVVEVLELVGDRAREIENHAGRVSIIEFYYGDIAGIVAIILTISFAASTALASGEGRVSDEG